MQVELTRFRVLPGKTERVNAWMQMLNDHLPAVLLTLNDERMCVEAIFREVVGADEFLYWFTVQGEGGSSLAQSPHEVDRLHLAFWEECIDRSYGGDPNYGGVDLTLQIVLMPESIQQAMLAHAVRPTGTREESE